MFTNTSPFVCELGCGTRAHKVHKGCWRVGGMTEFSENARWHLGESHDCHTGVEVSSQPAMIGMLWPIVIFALYTLWFVYLPRHQLFNNRKTGLVNLSLVTAYKCGCRFLLPMTTWSIRKLPVDFFIPVVWSASMFLLSSVRMGLYLQTRLCICGSGKLRSTVQFFCCLL